MSDWTVAGALCVGFVAMLLLAVVAHGLASLGDLIGLWNCRGC